MCLEGRSNEVQEVGKRNRPEVTLGSWSCCGTPLQTEGGVEPLSLYPDPLKLFCYTE